MRLRNIGKWLLGATVAAGISGVVIGAEIGDLSITDASNTARFPENLAAPLNNDSSRALEGLLARGLKDTIDGVLTTTNGSTVTALQFTPNRTISSAYTGLSFKVLFHTDVGANATLNPASLGAKDLVWPDGLNVRDAEIEQNAVLDVSYNLGKWYIQGTHTFGGATYLSGYISPTTLTSATQNNWAPTGIANASAIFITSNTSINLSGLSAGADSRIIRLWNLNGHASGFDVNILHESASSTVTNRFVNGQSVSNCVLGSGESANYLYNGTTRRWHSFNNQSDC